VKELLGSALELPPEHRAGFLASACGADSELRAEIEGLLAASDDASGFIEQPAIAAGVALMERSEAQALIGVNLGRYCIVELLGEGGVGTVYRATRDEGDYHQTVALKLLKRGMDSDVVLRRFRDERRILARLDHPNIAKFLDGGIAEDGRPYFVMEYLEGTPIHHYFRDNDLPVRQRLVLFLFVCAAVEYSHRNLVIHRDLKASNILVTDDGVPKLLDFGIAKLLDRDTSGQLAESTQAMDRMLTPDYASPEQILGEPITTATDVYSLGVLLFELLTETRPFQLSGLPAPEMARIITETDPPKPSSVVTPERTKALAGDIDTIVLKAMHRSPDRRYASAQQLAEDIRRHLDGLPVEARPDSPAYRARKFFGRNRTLVIVAMVSGIGLLTSGFVATWQSGVAAYRQQEMRKRFMDLRDLSNSLLGDLDSTLEALPGSTPARELLARRVLHYLDRLAQDEFTDASLQRDLATAFVRLGDILGGSKASNLGDAAGAMDSYRKALATLDKASKLDPNDLMVRRDKARVHSKLSDMLSITGKQAEALEEEQKALAIRESWLAARPSESQAKRAVAASLQEMAGDLDRLGRFDEALDRRRRVLAIVQELEAAGHADSPFRLSLALANRRIGRSLARAGKLSEALPHFRRALSIENAELGRHPGSAPVRTAISYTLNDTGIALAAHGDHAAAIGQLEEALRIRRELAAADPKDWRAHSLLANSQMHLGLSLAKAGRHAEALRELRESLAVRQSLSEQNVKNAGALAEVAEGSAALADASVLANRWSDAIPLYERARAIYTELRSRGSLTAELVPEPERIALVLARANR
jgi:non-specific serine/threonine protein kinase/serine/threonine-protein kinase